jgi:prepilin-type N-terminal cleavage/methylation domain-containing protein
VKAFRQSKQSANWQGSLPKSMAVNNRHLKYGFTLIELLVIIGIVALLAAILLPVFLAVRERARATACASNLRQLHLAFSQYASDNNGYVPPYVANGLNGSHVGLSFHGMPVDLHDQTNDCLAAINPYTHSLEIWYCPSDPDTGQNPSLWSYDFQGFQFGASIQDIVPHLMTSSPDAPLLTETGWLRIGTASYSHRGKYNEAYYDGHVKLQAVPVISDDSP